MPGKVIISNSTDPYTNLALEDCLFREHLSKECPNILLLYQNSPSVVIGRAQNPWLEANLPYLKKNNINLVRRQSGGGTVYHDLGNLNYCFLALNDYYLVDQHLRITTKALEDLGIKAIANKRNDLIIQTSDGIDKKISGSAFRTAKDRSFHHATLLINSNIDNLIQSISSTHKIFDAKGVQSIRSSVINLNQIKSDTNIEINSENIIKKISNKYMLMHNINQITQNTPDLNPKLKSELKSDKWIFEKTLGFDISIPLSIEKDNNSTNSNIECHINHGVIQEFKIINNKNSKNSLNKDIKIILKTLNKYCSNIPIYKSIASDTKTKTIKHHPSLSVFFHTVFLYLNKYCYTSKAV
jgi:lipoate---protein ligase